MSAGPPAPPTHFIGRENELGALASVLLSGPVQGIGYQVLVHGPTGIGKTTLVAQFAQMHRNALPGGVHYISSLVELESLEEVVREAEMTAGGLRPDQRSLVIIEELDHVHPGIANDFLEVLRKQRPQTQLILTSQSYVGTQNRLPLPRRDWDIIELAGFSEAEQVTLLRDHILEADDLSVLLASTGGNPLLVKTIAGLVEQGETVESLLARLHPATYPGLLGPNGHPLQAGSQPLGPLGTRLRAVGADLVEQVRRSPDLVHQMSPRDFEEFVAALYDRHGFEVELTPASRDGGVDLYAVRYEPYGKILTVVECKRNAPDRPVGVEVVRSLYGALEDKGASIGVLATTSTFTAGAKDMQQRHQFRLALQDWFALQDMLGGSGSTPPTNA